MRCRVSQLLLFSPPSDDCLLVNLTPPLQLTNIRSYIVDNRAEILGDVFDTVVNASDAAANGGMLAWDRAGIASAKVIVENVSSFQVYFHSTLF